MATQTVSNTPRVTALRLSAREYRRLHALAKSEAGAALNVQNYKTLGAWGQLSFMAGDVVVNAAVPRDVQLLAEAPFITLASRINVASVHACARPEMDWAAVPASKIYEFIFWHEVGHRVDNFNPVDFMTSSFREREDFRLWRHYFSRANEVLADRYAWKKILPGRPLVVASRYSAEYLQGLDDQIAQLSEVLPRGKYRVRPLPEGRAEYIPSQMLRNPSLARLAGFPEQHPRQGMDWAASRIGPQRPLLEAVSGCNVELVNREYGPPSLFDSRLCVGRDCTEEDAVAMGARYGFRSEEIASFLAGARPIDVLK